jgi:hypothetical protein
MASVHLLSVAARSAAPWPYAFDDLQRMHRSAAADRFGVHRLTDDPAAADIILFVENCDPARHYLEVRRHPVYRAHRDRCFLFSRHDFPIPFLPGIYASINRRWYDPERTRSGFYLDVFDKAFLTETSAATDREYLYSFIGQLSTDPIRAALTELTHPAQFVFDTSDYWPYADLPDDTRQALEAQYVEVARQSRFVLCPRGRGVSSIRLFEMMRMGRAPVIIADDWVPPSGPDWDRFSLRVPEARVGDLPALLEARAEEAVEMGLHAQAAWNDWFAPGAAFHRVADWCLELQATRPATRWRTPYRVGRQLTEPKYFRSALRTAIDYARPA